MDFDPSKDKLCLPWREAAGGYFTRENLNDCHEVLVIGMNVRRLVFAGGAVHANDDAVEHRYGRHNVLSLSFF